MKLFAAAAIALLVAGPSLAGGLAEPVMESNVSPALVEADTRAGSDGGILVPLFALLLFGVAVTSGGGSQPPV